MRDFVLNNINIIEALDRIIGMQRMNKTFLRTVCWLNSNLCRFKNLGTSQVSYYKSYLKDVL